MVFFDSGGIFFYFSGIFLAIVVFFGLVLLSFVVFFEFCGNFFGYCGIFLTFVFLIFVVCFDFGMTFLLATWIVRRTAQIAILVNSDVYEPIRS